MTSSPPALPGRPGTRPTIAAPTVGKAMHLTSVVTPEAVLLEFRTAGLASRILAKLVDALVQFGLFVAVAVAAGTLASSNETSGIIAVIVGAFLVLFAYPATEVFGGQTLGKRALGIRVITVEGAPITFSHAAIRALIWIVEFFLPPGGLLALGSALATKRSQRFGDLAAGTLVVRVGEPTLTPMWFPPAQRFETFSRDIDTSRLSPPGYALVREFLSRVPQLDPAARSRVAGIVSARIEAETGQPRPADVPPESYLVAVVFGYQRLWEPKAAQAPTGPPIAPTGSHS